MTYDPDSPSFFFTAQTGEIRHRVPQVRSNFYCYRLASRHLGKVAKAAEMAKLGSGGLEYPAEFLAWLRANDLNVNDRGEE